MAKKAKEEATEEKEVLTPAEKKRRIKSVLASFTKKNEGATVSFGDPDFGKMGTVKSGIKVLDRLTDDLPKGQYVQIVGGPGVGKTTAACRLIGELQKENLVCAFANNERRFSMDWAVKNGVNAKELIGGNFQDLEQCLDFCIKMATEKLCDCLVIDTITALASRGEVVSKKGDRSVNDNTMALIPRKLSQFFRMATAAVADSGMIVIMINQVRLDLSNPLFVKETNAGGNALEHYCSLKIILTNAARKEWPGPDEKHPTGRLINVRLDKASHSMKSRKGDKTCLNFFDGIGFDNDYDTAYHARKQVLIYAEGQSKWIYKTLAGEELSITAGSKTVDQKMKEFLIERNLISEVDSRLVSKV
jgi:RecA/RadA recombinase